MNTHNSSNETIQQRKTVLVHDSFFIKGGAERMNIEIAKILNADIYSAVFKKESFDLEAMGFCGNKREILPSFQRGMFGFLAMKLAFLTRCQGIGDYPVVLFSNEGISARVWARKSKKVYYAHSISRHLFDQKSQYVSKVTPWLRPLFSLALLFFRQWYLRDLRAMDLILANSQTNASFLGKLAPKVPIQVLYPPVNTKEFYPLPPDAPIGSYFLSYARLTHAKRIDVIIQAFLRMPELKLKVVYGKNDPQLKEFRNLAKEAQNIEFITLSDNSELPDIVRNAIATICVSRNEDFGMVAVESMASGTPVIAVGEGGYLESVIAGKTGILLKPDFSSMDLVEAVRSFTPDLRNRLSAFCVERACDFSLERFEQKLREYLEN